MPSGAALAHLRLVHPSKKMMMISPRKTIVSLSVAIVLSLPSVAVVTFAAVTSRAAPREVELSTADVIPRPLPPEVVEEKVAALQRAESVGTVFMLGLIFGMVSGVGLFFLYLRRQQNKHARHDPSDYLFEDWPNRPARGLREGGFGSGRGSRQTPPADPAAGDRHSDGSDEMIEQPEPWERSVDWWKGEPEE